MAPEQVEGLEADARTDIFAFGALLYEMLTGRKAFEASGQASLIAAILERQPPPLAQVQPLTPASLDHVVGLCLAKDRENRWQSIRDVREQLRWIAAGGGASPEKTRPVPARRVPERLALIALVSLATVAGALGMWALGAEEPEPSVARLSISLSSSPRPILSEQGIAISPDGKRIVYRAGETASTSQLYMRALDAEAPVALRGTERPASPFFSPDGEWVAFFSDGKLKRVPVAGGAALDICDVVAAGRGGTWGPDDTIVFATADVNFAGLLRVAASGGTPAPLTTPDRGRHAWPTFLPDGKTVLFAAVAGTVQWDDADIVARRLDTGDQRVVFSGGTRPRYLPTGHLVVERAGNLLVVPFDAAGLQAVGSARAALEGVMANQTSGGVAQYDVSGSGTVVYATADHGESDREIAWVDRKGASRTIEGISRPVSEATIAPDGRTLALSLQGENRNIWTFDLTRGTLSRLTFGDGIDQYPRWTPDGHRIAYSSTKDGPYQVYWKAADGSGGEDLLVKAELPGNFPKSFSPDGKWLLFQRGVSSGANDLWVTATDGSASRPFVATPGNEIDAQFSPDGRWVAYQSNESGQAEVYVQAFEGKGGKWQISTGNGQLPRWRHDGRELFFRQGDDMMAVSVTVGAGPSFTAGAPERLFGGPFERLYDVSRQGDRFLMIKRSEASNQPQLNVVLNWAQELKSSTPAR